jgi:hypothetical protein
VSGKAAGGDPASVWCSRCEILLEGREQFVGHMVHGHDEPVEQASSAWNLAFAQAHVEKKGRYVAATT